MAKVSKFRVDWSELKPVILNLISGNYSDFKNRENGSKAQTYVVGGTWEGYTDGQLQRWLTEGFKTEAIHGLDEFIPPIREKRKFVFADEGDEFHLDKAYAGDDNYMSRFTKREEIPGLAISAEIGMSATVNATVLNAYYTWLCKVAYSIESAGIDTEITLHYEADRMMFSGDINAPATTVIRVKKENEASDFLSWSAMLSPASFRCCMFIANCLHADSVRKVQAEGQGTRSSNSESWSVKFIPETRTLKVVCPWRSAEFPEENMTRQLREALKEGTTKVNQ